MEEMERALRLDPNDAVSQAFYGHMLMIMGRPDEARRQGERAVQLDPRNSLVVGLYGTILAFAGPPEEGIQVLEAMFEDNPGVGFGYYNLANAYRRAGLTDEETRSYRNEMAVNGWDWVVTAMDQGMEEGGSREARRRAAEAMADRFEETYQPAFYIAVFFRGAGEREKALDWLERSVEQHDPNLPYIGLSGWEDFYDHPRVRR
jgi:predicted Zn-dependent protease